MTFNTPEEAVAYAMSIQPKPKFFKEKISGRTARIYKFGRYPYDFIKVTSPDWGKYFIDIQGFWGSDNRGIPETFPTYEEARTYIESMGFKPAE